MQPSLRSFQLEEHQPKPSLDLQQSLDPSCCFGLLEPEVVLSFDYPMLVPESEYLIGLELEPSKDEMLKTLVDFARGEHLELWCHKTQRYSEKKKGNHLFHDHVNQIYPSACYPSLAFHLPVLEMEEEQKNHND